MKKSLWVFTCFSLVTLLLLSSCRSEFEIIRTSNDPEKMLTEANRLYKIGEYYKAITLYELLIPVYRGTAEAEDISWRYAYAHYNQKKYISSAHYFKQFANTFANSERKEEADYMSAYSHFQLSPSHKLDQTSTRKAIDALQVFINSYTDSPRVAECNKLIDEMRAKMELKSYNSAKLYYKLKNFDSTVVAFENMLKDYPGSNNEQEARYLIAKASYRLAENSVYSKKEERFLATLEKCELFVKKFPQADNMSEINTYISKSKQELNKIKNG